MPCTVVDVQEAALNEADTALATVKLRTRRGWGAAMVVLLLYCMQPGLGEPL